MNKLNTIETTYTKTRKQARILAKHLKAKGLFATSKDKKTDQGWLVNVASVSRKAKQALNVGNKIVTVVYR